MSVAEAVVLVYIYFCIYFYLFVIYLFICYLFVLFIRLFMDPQPILLSTLLFVCSDASTQLFVGSRFIRLVLCIFYSFILRITIN